MRSNEKGKREKGKKGKREKGRKGKREKGRKGEREKGVLTKVQPYTILRVGSRHCMEYVVQFQFVVYGSKCSKERIAAL